MGGPTRESRLRFIRIVRTIAAKELRESFRDRRTLFLMIFLPILLYPVLLLLMTQVAVMQQSKLAEQRSRVAYRGAPADHPLLEYVAQDDRLEVAPLEQAAGADAHLGEDIDLIVDLSEAPPGLTLEGTSRVRLEFTSIEDASRQAAERVEARLERWRESEVARRLAAYQLSTSVVEPVAWERVDRSRSSERGGYALGMILPMLVIATVLLGAYYPAVDLTAGEKERGSIQTLFTAPVSTFEIVTGKYVAVLLIAMVSGMANLLSLALIFGQNLFVSADLFEQIEVDLSLSAGTIALLFLNIVLIGVFFSALLLTVAVLAKSYKEGQTYLAPVYLACFLPAAVASMPGFQLTPQLALVPAFNVTLLMREVMVGSATLESIFLVIASTAVFTTLTLVAAAKLFAQEQTILGERGSLKLFARPAPGQGAERPTLGQGLAWYGVVLILLFYVGGALQSRQPQLGLLATLWVVVLLPTLGFARFFRLDLKATFHLRAPAKRMVLAAVLLGSSAWVLVALANAWLDAHVLRAPPELFEAMAGVFGGPESWLDWVWLLFLVAVSPAICEEALARGVVFSSLRQRVAPWVLVLGTGFLFGLLHLNLFRLFGTTALGVVMGLLVYKSGSIWTSVIFHGLNNGVALVAVALLADHWAIAEAGDLPMALVLAASVMAAVGLALLALERSPWRSGAEGG